MRPFKAAGLAFRQRSRLSVVMTVLSGSPPAMLLDTNQSPKKALRMSGLAVCNSSWYSLNG